MIAARVGRLLSAVCGVAWLWLGMARGALAQEEHQTVNGLYPIWEQTGVLHGQGEYQIGYGHAQIGLGRVQVATQPFLDVYGTWNLQGKVALWRGEWVRSALWAGVYRLPTDAEDLMIGNLRAPGFSNPYAPVWLLPMSNAHSIALTARINLHVATTVLLSYGELAGDRHVSFGKTLLLEARASRRWWARLHAGAEGIGVQGMAHLGMSFVYRGGVVFAEAGAARRVTFEGEQSNLLMLDAGLLFR